MFRFMRNAHKWLGLTLALALALISVTGFLLATKGSIGWIRPPERDGQPVATLSETVSVHDAALAAYSVGLPELQNKGHIDRIDYRPDSNVFKVVSNEGYHEVQVCGKTGQVLQVAKRNDQLVEDLHDFSFIAKALHTYALPVAAFGLLSLSVSGVAMFFVPVIRRRQFKRNNPPKKSD